MSNGHKYNSVMKNNHQKWIKRFKSWCNRPVKIAIKIKHLVINFGCHSCGIILSEKPDVINALSWDFRRKNTVRNPGWTVWQRSCIITVYLHCMEWTFFDHFNKFEWDLFLMMFVIWRKSKNEFNPKWNMFYPFISMNSE